MKKHITGLLLGLLLCLANLSPAAGAAFPDISDKATQDAVSLLGNLGIVKGYEDGTFRPDGTLTRAEFCTMAVLLSGMKDVSTYESVTIFPDVRGNHWARGYINAAVRALKVVTGFPDGTFKPEDPITYAQAVTALMRLIGYSDSDVGANWPQSYMNKAAQIGLTEGIYLGTSNLISRSFAALLLRNAIFTEGRNGAKYSDMLGFHEERLIVRKTDAASPDGGRRGLVTIGGAGFYPCRTALDIEEGSRGTLLIDADGYVLSWTPDNQSVAEIVVREVGPMSVTGANGSKIDNIPSSAIIYVEGDVTSWGSDWYDIVAGTILRFYFTASGAVDYIIRSGYSADYSGVVKIIPSEPAPGSNPLPELGIGANARVFKNGAPATWSNLRGSDVIVYNEFTNTVDATDFRITGIYENALPGRDAPDYVITLGGRSFPVTPEVRMKLSEMKIGDRLTFLFTPDGRVADVRPGGGQPAYQPGIVKGDRSVELYNGIIISAQEAFAWPYRDGAAVMACMPEPGKLGLQLIQDKDSVELDILEMTAGSVPIAPYAVFYDLSGSGGRAIQVDRASLPDVIKASSVLSVNFEPGGRANLIVLRNVTGDAWLYGFTTLESGRYNSFELPDGTIYTEYLSTIVHLETWNARYAVEDPRNLGRESGDSVYGIAVGTSGIVIASQACARVNNVKRSDFSGSSAVLVSGELRPIPVGLMVYLEATGEYVSISEARLLSNNFTVFLDKPASDGGKVRFIVAL